MKLKIFPFTIMIHMTNSSLRVVSIIRGYHVYKDDWNPYMLAVQLNDASRVFLSSLETLTKLERVLITIFLTNIYTHFEIRASNF